MARGAIARRTFEAALSAAALAVAGLVVAAAFPRAAAVSPATAAATLRRDPLDAPALRITALAATDVGETRRTLEFLIRGSWRDGPTDAWLLRDRLARGDLTGALDCADALLRLDATGKTRPALFDLLTKATGFVEARPPLVARLSANPWWRQDFLRYLDVHGDPLAATLLFSDMAGGPRPVRPVEYAPLIDRLVANGNYREAIAAWRGVTPDPARASAPLHDGDFAQAWDLTPFTWRPTTGIGAISEVGEEPGGQRRRVLRIDYDGFAAPSLPAQLLVLPVGRWRLGWRLKGDAQADQALYWRVRCADTGAVLAGGPAASADTGPTLGWRPRTLTFTTPSDGCHGQWLELTGAPGERRTQVTAWYADFRLRPETQQQVNRAAGTG